MYELVTAVMVTRNDPKRRPLMRASIFSFLGQSFQNSKLLIANAGEPLTKDCYPTISLQDRVHEIRISPEECRTLGDHRNAACAHVDTPYAITWDDDDYSASDRIASQFAAINVGRGGKACVLARYTVLDLVSGAAFERSCRSYKCKGCSGLIMWDTSADSRYPSRERHEDSNFAEAFHERGLLTVLENAPSMYIRTVHGSNTTPREHTMREHGRKSLTALQRLAVEAYAAGMRICGVTIPKLVF